MKFWIDFEGYCSIEAENQEEAEQKFWNSYSNKNLIDEWLEITCVEKDEWKYLTNNQTSKYSDNSLGRHAFSSAGAEKFSKSQ